jgi:hypothetical protein
MFNAIINFFMFFDLGSFISCLRFIYFWKAFTVAGGRDINLKAQNLTLLSL